MKFNRHDRKKYRARYPWEWWLSREHNIIVKGKDYNCTTVSMMQMVRYEARDRGRRIMMRKLKDKDGFELWVFPIERNGKHHPNQDPLDGPQGPGSKR